jgi:hypothetical protein
MTQEKQQSFSNHARFHPLFHFITAPLLLANLILGIVLIARGLHTQVLLSIWIVIASATPILILLLTRTYPLKVQDRLIRLEERLRMDALLPETMRKRIPELSESQLVGLRFASDAELPTLVELTLDKHLTQKQIKERIQSWRPDHFRV